MITYAKILKRCDNKLKSDFYVQNDSIIVKKKKEVKNIAFNQQQQQKELKDSIICKTR